MALTTFKIRRPLTAALATALAVPVLFPVEGRAIDVPLINLNASPTTSPPPGENFQITGSEIASFDSNPLMLVHPGQSLIGSTTAPELIYRDNTPTVSFLTDTQLQENIFNQSAYDSTDAHEKLSLNEQMERWSAGFEARGDYDTTRTSEFTTYGLNLPRVRHTGLSIAPDIAFNSTPVDKWSLGGSVATSHYDNSAFVDYNVFSLNPSYEHKFDPMNSGTITLNAQRYEATSNPQERVDTIGPSLGWTTTLTPQLTAKFSAGLQRSLQDASAANADSSTWNYVFGSDIVYKGQQDNIDFNASRAQYPFGNGTETLLTSFGATETHAINKLFSVNIGGLYAFAQSAPGAGVNLDYELNGNAGLAYHMTENIDLTANYQYKNESLTEVNGTIQEHMVLLGITYHPFAGDI